MGLLLLPKFHSIPRRSAFLLASFHFLSNVNDFLIVSYREELTFEMLVLEPRASDDETHGIPRASIGTADSSENLNIESEGAISEKSGK